MKSTFYIFIYALAGLICGIIWSLINTAFIPKCGEPCSVHRVGELVSWTIIFTVLFLVIGFISIKKFKDEKKAFYSLLIISFATIATACSFYFYKLNEKYWALEAKQVYVDFDFQEMYISIEKINAQNTNGGEIYEIKKWQKCAGAEVFCDSQPRKVKLQCRENGNNIYPLVNEKDWMKLKNVESENLPGLAIEKDTENKFCKNN